MKYYYTAGILPDFLNNFPEELCRKAILKKQKKNKKLTERQKEKIKIKVLKKSKYKGGTPASMINKLYRD